ncbi:hypothetical protein E8E13_001551 [Curvularia kusanoi]|uniref:Heterokaryon incompatibility domain-containing protein n=1 Tax=Curvularia kusanoi TaxID=90978 RepID=A0A9P4W5L9_CURKU|nr:hypothetical protein E8E13_001551 [Curvularia kusanoi]
MWLLNTHTITLRNFIADIPNYVILSHTWEEEEVTFDDIGKPDQCATMKGYAKILGCCRQAVQDGFEWAWIDTCCIDKRSSAELSEAINSMYKWYWNAGICYAYISDFSDHGSVPLDLGYSKWFTRGWTLQELLAPSPVEFYTQSWSFIGTKAGMLKTLQDITKIDEQYLEDRDKIRLASTATKFSWASLRETTREEDIAYCLLGLVGVNMPMLYGEGYRAFNRLQLEILRKTNDHTIFAWNFHYSTPSPLVGVLAPSPFYFADSADTRPSGTPRPTESLTHEITNNGLRITLPIVETDDKDELVALLHCENKKGSRLGIHLGKAREGSLQYGRFRSSDGLMECGQQRGRMSTLYMMLETEAQPDLEKFDYIDIRNVQGNCGYQISNVSLNSSNGHEHIDTNAGSFRLYHREIVLINLALTPRDSESIAILFGLSSGGHPVCYAIGPALEINETFRKAWSSALSDTLLDQANVAGTDRQRVVMYDRGQHLLIEVKCKKCLRSERQVWVVSIQITK